MDPNFDILIIQMGGTIDKDYPKRQGGYAFEIGKSATNEILQRIQPQFRFHSVSVCRKDSQEIDDTDRSELVQMVSNRPERRILVTHGTDTLIETSQYLEERVKNKRVVVTGSFKPHTFKDSDAEFNIGFALGVLTSSNHNQVLVTMNGCAIDASLAERDDKSGNFVSKIYKSN